MICRYPDCEEELDEHYTYMPFKDTDNQVMMMKPVHTYHLNGTRNMSKTIPYERIKNVDPQTQTNTDITSA